MRKFLYAALAIGLVAASATSPAVAASNVPLKNVSSLAIENGPVTGISGPRNKIDPALRTAKGTVRVIVSLSDESLARFNSAGFKQLSRAGAARNSAQAQRDYISKLGAAQDAFAAQAATVGAVTTHRFTKALNAVAMKVDAAKLDQIAALPGVATVRGISDYELDLSETVPYIGATAVQDMGYDGAGVVVAVLDSGIDYTHANLGGAGTAAAYEAAYGTTYTDTRTTTRDGLFPTAKVIDGYDFVGEKWPTYGEEEPDPDPIDAPPDAPTDGGHGSHVADIIGGTDGVAPGASLVAIKVCSAVSSSCSGIALIQGVEFALDPNGDGDMSDAVDVMNLSLGSAYGQKEDDLSFALGNAVHAGVVVVVSAGNNADRPYILGSPSSQPEVLSVAQTAVPGAKTFPLVVNSPASIAGQIKNTNTVEWAPLTTGFTGDVAYVGTACPGQALAANPAGKVALIDRGTCAISLKVDAVTKAGAIAALVANNVSGDPPSFSFGGGDLPMVQTLILTLADGNKIKSGLAGGGTVNVSVSDAVSIPLVGSMVASSSRGPSYSYSAIKPEIGAPGASISAISGSGTKTEAFGGTSGAAPMVSGAAALVLDAHPDYSPRDVKAALVTTADTNIQINPATLPGVLAPITRIGGGEVRVDKAVKSTTAAWAADDDNPALSFGFQTLAENAKFRKRVIVRNYSANARTYTITPSFRYDNDAASGAVTPSAPATINVPANGSRSFVIELAVDASKLPAWPFAFGNLGTGSILQSVEFDGYLTISDATDSVHLPWHILPRKSADVNTDDTRVAVGDKVTLKNGSSVNDGDVDVFALTGVSPRVAKSDLPGPGYNYYRVDLKAAGFRPVIIGVNPDGSFDFGIQFAIATNDVRAHPNYPAEFDVYIDTNRDGEYDYVLYNSEATGFGSTGQCLVNVVDLATGLGGAYFYCDGDFNSGNIVFTAPLEVMGLTLDSEFAYSVLAYDNYFWGTLSDSMWYMVSIVASPTYFANVDFVSVPAGGSEEIEVLQGAAYGNAVGQANGLLLFYNDAKLGKESQVVRVR
jgi:subtilisin family serine protease